MFQTRCFSIDTVDTLSNHYLLHNQKSLQRSTFFHAAAGQPAQTKCFCIDTVGRLSNQKSDIFARETFFWRSRASQGCPAAGESNLWRDWQPDVAASGGPFGHTKGSSYSSWGHTKGPRGKQGLVLLSLALTLTGGRQMLWDKCQTDDGAVCVECILACLIQI